MSISKRITVMVMAVVFGVASLQIAAELPIGITGYVSKAEAIVGRPLTPVSVAGVARRTVRRCAVGVYC